MGVRVMVVERYAFVREALRIAIHPMPRLELVAEARSGTEAVGLAIEEEPGVILLDVDWPSLAGLAAIPLLRGAVPDALIVAYSSEPEFESARPGFDAGGAAIAAGADAYLTAAATLEEMVAVLQAGLACSTREWDLEAELAGVAVAPTTKIFDLDTPTGRN
jgi:DNA-binding NarL/FixJ family response regulator